MSYWTNSDFEIRNLYGKAASGVRVGYGTSVRSQYPGRVNRHRKSQEESRAETGVCWGMLAPFTDVPFSLEIKDLP